MLFKLESIQKKKMLFKVEIDTNCHIYEQCSRSCQKLCWNSLHVSESHSNLISAIWSRSATDLHHPNHVNHAIGQPVHHKLRQRRKTMPAHRRLGLGRPPVPSRCTRVPGPCTWAGPSLVHPVQRIFIFLVFFSISGPSLLGLGFEVLRTTILVVFGSIGLYTQQFTLPFICMVTAI